MSARAAAAVVTATLTTLASPALASAASADVGALAAGHPTVRIGTVAKAVWHEDGDVLCVHAGKRDAEARFRTSGGRVVRVVDFAGGRPWSCTLNLNVPENDRVRLVLRWKYLGVNGYARTTSLRITT